MSVGFLSLLQQPTLQQLRSGPEDEGGCFKRVFLPPSPSPNRHWENPITCNVFQSAVWPDSKSSTVSTLLPAPRPKARQGFGVDGGAQRCLQLHTSELAVSGMRRAPEGNHVAEVCCQRTCKGCAARSCSSPVCSFPLGFWAGEFLLTSGKCPPPPINKKVIKGSVCSSEWQ